MTLVVAALDCSVSVTALNRVVSKLLEDAFQDSPAGMEYLRRELSQHIQGWRSSACVRMLLAKATTTWRRLEQEGHHWPGFIPANDETELHEFLVWLITGDDHDRSFKTGSSDVFCFAALLEEIGMELFTTHDQTQMEPHLLCVSFSEELAARRRTERNAGERWGMRIPLDSMEECMSLWPGDQGFRNDLRGIFADAMHQLSEDETRARFTFAHGRPYYRIETGYVPERRKRLAGTENRAATMFLPKHAYRSASYFGKLISRWPEADLIKFETQLRHDPNAERMDSFHGLLSRETFAKLQGFLMGFYYALLYPLLNTDCLLTREAFGCWGYCDVGFLKRIASVIDRSRSNQAIGGDWTSFRRSDVLGLAAYMLAGAELETVDRTTSTASIGVLAKLSVLTGTCLGAVDSFRIAGR
ncbi:hypothetical protein LTR08_005282 [Meristemomyces frigidus]|nr:hypothetical protein LTR08_005282 [Meristemomyces frigidus]